MGDTTGPELMQAEDQPGIAEVVRAVYAEYGFTWDASGYYSDLADPASHYARFWVVRDGGQVVGCAGLSLHDRVPGDLGGTVDLDGEVRASGTDCELVRLYLLAEYRGRRLGKALAMAVLGEARARGRIAMEVWSDKRLGEAHALYRQLGCVCVGERICPGDPDESPEWGFALRL